MRHPGAGTSHKPGAVMNVVFLNVACDAT
jgi:hypothetical protein